MTSLAARAQILPFRELGFGLREIRRIMTDPRFDRRRAYQRAAMRIYALGGST